MSIRQPGELPSAQLSAITANCNMVIARLESDPDSVAEWKSIEAALRQAAAWAGSYRACYEERAAAAENAKEKLK